MNSEYEILIDMLATIREELLEEDFIDNQGHDCLSACVGSPVEVLAIMKIKMNRLLKKVEMLEDDNLKLDTELSMIR